MKYISSIGQLKLKINKTIKKIISKHILTIVKEIILNCDQYFETNILNLHRDIDSESG